MLSTDVLVVEDDDAVRSSFVKVLEHAGFRVTSAENGQAALDALADLDHSCRAIVCDLHMPVLTGMGFMRKLRTEFPHLIDRVLFVTAYDRDSDLRRFLGSHRVLARLAAYRHPARRVMRRLGWRR